MRVESESSHESLRSVLELSQVTSHRGLKSIRVTQSCRVMPESESLPITAISGNANHCTERAYNFG